MNFDTCNRLSFWCQKVLPLVYDESLSYYELLCKVVKYINDIITEQKRLAELYGTYDVDIAQLKADVADLQSELEKVKNGDYVSVYIDALSNWIDANLQQLVSRIVKYVTFGLTTNGYFCAHIPHSWDFISFNTIMDATSSLYGHLALQW